MTRARLNLDDRLTVAVREVLLNEWDPIRLQELSKEIFEANCDEYDDYLDEIVDLVRIKAGEQAIELHLHSLSVQILGNDSEQVRAKTAAKMLAAL